MFRKYPRAKFHDYNDGLYFITIVTKNRAHYFGNVVEGKMHLNMLGERLTRCIEEVHLHYNDAEIHNHVIMPNHFHAIVAVGPRHAATLCNTDVNLGCLRPPRHPNEDDDFNMRNHHNARLSVVVGGIKSVVTRFANHNGIEFGWQANFHDHIIRNQLEYDLISEYIGNNPLQWGNDMFFYNTIG